MVELKEIEQNYSKPEDLLDLRAAHDGLSLVSLVASILTMCLIATWYSWVPAAIMCIYGTFWDLGEEHQKQKIK